jgi:hypothetical protein
VSRRFDFRIILVSLDTSRQRRILTPGPGSYERDVRVGHKVWIGLWRRDPGGTMVGDYSVLGTSTIVMPHVPRTP